MKVHNTDLHWIVLTSTLLPAKWLAQLRELLTGCGRPHELVMLAPTDAGGFTKFLATYRFRRPYATCRLDDDDDALCPEYHRLLSKYAGEPDNTIVSFFRGRTASLVQGVVTVSPRPFRWKWNAQGMARINGDVYAAGNHCRVALEAARTHAFKVVQDETPNVYVYFQDPITLHVQKFNEAQQKKNKQQQQKKLEPSVTQSKDNAARKWVQPKKNNGSGKIKTTAKVVPPKNPQRLQGRRDRHLGQKSCQAFGG